MKPIHLRRPDEIVEAINDAEHGCASCKWKGKLKELRGKPGCTAGQGFYPWRGMCSWYKAKVKR